jgi:hypothetical protein
LTEVTAAAALFFVAFVGAMIIQPVSKCTNNFMRNGFLMRRIVYDQIGFFRS